MIAVGRALWWRLGLAATVGAGLTYFVLAVSIAGVFGDRRPEIALQWRPTDARANAALSALMLSGTRKASQKQIEDRARRAVRRDPTTVDAVRVLASLDVQSNRDRARQLMGYALALSRRDLPTHIWYIEDYVARGSVAGALYHYDAALRTSRRASSVLIPVLASASSQPKVVSELGPILEREPAWRDAFLEALVRDGEGFDTWFPLATEYLDPRDPREADLIQILLNRLIAAGNYALAARLDGDKTEAEGRAAAIVRNGGFDQQPQFTPFDWILANEQGFSAEIAMHDEDANPALTMDVGSGRQGVLASQLLRLAAGHYRVSAKNGDTESDGQVYLTVRCIETNRPLLRSNAPRADEAPKTFQAEFSVPANACPAQWLDVGALSGNSRADNDPWLDSIAINRVP